MELTGLTLGQVLAVLGGAGAAVVVLYLLKLRRRRVRVPFVQLWETVLAERQTTRLLSQLKRWISLLIALAIVALLALSLGDPRYAGATKSGRTLVVLLDASASMQATDVEPSRFGRAKERVERLIEGLGPADRMLIAHMADTTRPVSPLSDEPRVLREALEPLEPADVAADARAGVRLALDVLRGTPNPEVVLLTDGRLPHADDLAERLEESGVRLSWEKVGTSDGNVGISAFSVRRYPLDKSQTEVLVELWNPTEQERKVEVSLLGDGEPVDVQRLTLHGKERLRRFFQNVSGVDRKLEATIAPADDAPDHLPADDRAYARLPERRRARVLAVTEGNLYLRAALLLDEYLDVTDIPPEQYPVEGDYDVVVFDNWVPPSPPESADALYIHPAPAEGVQGPFEVRGTIERPFFDELQRKHPLLRWTALHDVNVAEALDVKLQRGDRAVAADDRGPLIVTGRRGGRRFVALTFDVRRSDLPLRIAWPLLLLNAVDWFTHEGDDDYMSSFRTGETWHIPVAAGVDQAQVTSPDGRERQVPVVDGRAVYAGTRSGFYEVQTEAGTQLFAANLGPSDESHIEPLDALEVAGARASTVSEGKPGLRRELWIYLVLAVLAILTVEWLTYHRRWTV